MIKELIEKLAAQEDLSISEAYSVMEQIMSGELNNSQIAAILMGLKTKSESAEEVAGFAKAMRDKGIKIKSNYENTIDLCGTGGDYSGTFNISTAASFVVAGCGIHVAKHGNRSISSSSGSADVLNELGININLDPAQSEKALNEIGIAFLFAPLYHPAMKHAAPVRKELGVKTIFNVLGPLTNPAGTKRQLIGTFNSKASRLMARAAVHLDMEKVCFICTGDKFDEVSLTEITEVNEFSNSADIKSYEISHKSFSYDPIDVTKIQGGTPQQNAKIIYDLFSNKEKNDAFYVVAANSAMALFAAGYSDDIKECTAAAEESILSGKALNKLNSLKLFGENAA